MMTNSAPKPWRSQDRNAYDLDAVRAAAASGKGPSEPQPRMSKTRRTSVDHPPQVRPSSSGGSSSSFANFHNRGAEDRGSSSSNRPNSAPSREIESRLKAASSTSDYAQDEGDDVLHAFRALVAADADARTENSSFDIPFVSSASNVEKEEDDGRPRTSKGGGGIGSFASHHNRRSTLRQEESNDVRPSTATGEGQPKPFGLGVVTNGNSNGKGRFRSSSQSYTINESSNHPQLSPTSPVFAFAHDSAMPTSSTPQSQYSVPSKTSSSSSRPSVSSILSPPLLLSWKQLKLKPIPHRTWIQRVSTALPSRGNIASWRNSQLLLRRTFQIAKLDLIQHTLIHFHFPNPILLLGSQA